MLKKLIITTCILTFGFQIAKGQAALLVLIFGDKAATESFYFSLKGGINYSGLPGLNEYGYKPDIHFGLANNIRINDNWYLVPEFVALSRRGAQKLELNPTGNPEIDSLKPASASLTRNLSYLDIPILVRYIWKDKFTLEFGPQVSFLTRADEKYEATFEDKTEFTYSMDSKENHTSLDFGGVISLGYIISDSRGGKGMEFHLRYYEGFVNISKFSGQNYRNRMFQVSVSFPFILPEETVIN